MGGDKTLKGTQNLQREVLEILFSQECSGHLRMDLRAVVAATNTHSGFCQHAVNTLNVATNLTTKVKLYEGGALISSIFM